MIDFGAHVPEKKSFDLTPMLDVVFLLLIFFLLTSIFARPTLPLRLPEAETARVAEESPVRVVLGAGGAVQVNEREIDGGGLAETLARLLGESTRKEISLSSDRHVPFGSVVEVMDLAKKSGAETISVVTERKP
jgi:biopolymer transport protein ExbD